MPSTPSRKPLRKRLERAMAIVQDETESRPERARAARRAAWAAERLGVLHRPKRCEGCGQRRPLERHHPDHTQALSILWLCEVCHRAADHFAGVSKMVSEAG